MTGNEESPAGPTTSSGSSAAWDPVRYLRFAGERARPFVELVARIAAEAPETVVDLGCGEGALTASLAQRWPGARVTGVDSSATMLAAAPEASGRTESGLPGSEGSGWSCPTSGSRYRAGPTIPAGFRPGG